MRSRSPGQGVRRLACLLSDLLLHFGTLCIPHNSCVHQSILIAPRTAQLMSASMRPRKAFAHGRHRRQLNHLVHCQCKHVRVQTMVYLAEGPAVLPNAVCLTRFRHVRKYVSWRFSTLYVPWHIELHRRVTQTIKRRKHESQKAARSAHARCVTHQKRDSAKQNSSMEAAGNQAGHAQHGGTVALPLFV
jgi:hypothetical protein